MVQALASESSFDSRPDPRASAMANTSRTSPTARAAVSLLLALACWRASTWVQGFVASSVGGRPAPKTALRYNIFENPFDFDSGADSLNPDEVGTLSQKQVDGESREVECRLPLGVQFEERDGGDIYIKTVAQDSDAFSQGVRPGAQLTMISATFGDEMWQARKVGMVQFQTVLNSRFGSTIKLALAKESKNFLTDFFSSLAPAPAPMTAKKQESLMSEFERQEKDLEGKNFFFR
uniref:PDZ domain-containing protein n=1 Tax=Spumella elongata TaxID=89044 RepID=A0A7S3HSD3_9STRA